MDIKKARQALLNKWDWENPENNLVLYIHGSIGVGKTYLIQQVVAERKLFELEKIEKGSLTENQKNQILRLKSYKDPKEIKDIIEPHLLMLRVSQRSLEFFSGIPSPNFAEKSAAFLMPDCLLKLKDVDWCVVFLDEIDKADDPRFTAITYLVESRKLGDFSFPKDTFVVACLNKVTDSWLSKELPNELKNRGAHITLDVSIKEWLKWAEGKIRPDIIEFHKFKQSLNENYLAIYEDSNNDANFANSFPTPRTWHFASLQADKLEKKGSSFEEIADEMSQFVGSKAITEYKNYIRLYREVDVEGIINGSKKIPQARQGDNKAISNQYVHVFAICNYLKVEHIKDENRMKNLMDNINLLMDDLKIAFLLTISSSKPDVNNKIHESKHGEALIDWFLEKVSSI